MPRPRVNDEAAKCVDRVRKYLVDTPLLDIGCGFKAILPWAIGFDRNPHADISGDVLDLSCFKDGSVGSLFSSHCLEDIEDTHAALKEWARVLRPGGHMVLYLPHADFYPNIGDPRGNPDHKHDFRPWDIVKLVQSSPDLGLEILETSVHGYEGNYDDIDKYTAEYSFDVILRKRVGAEPEWAQPRLWIPVEGFQEAAVEIWPNMPADVKKIAVVSEERRLPPGDMAAKTCAVWVDPKELRDPDDMESKAVVAMAHIVVDLTDDAASCRWASSYDVDGFYIGKGAPSHLSMWPRQTVLPSESLAWEAAREFLSKEDGLVSVCMIVKDEEKHLPKLLKSIEGLHDEIIVVDTGSTDRTPEIARQAGALVYHFPWRDDFAWARNLSLERARSKWSVWFDADDTLVAPEPKALREFLENPPPNTSSLNARITFGDSVFDHCRFFLTEKHFYFTGMVHEYPVVDPNGKMGSNISISHSVEYTPSKDRVARNVRICEKQVKAEPETPRWHFYLGNAYRDAGRLWDAVWAYEDYLEKEFPWPEERALVMRRLGECYDSLGNEGLARDWMTRSAGCDDRWPDTYFSLGYMYYRRGDMKRALRWLQACVNTPKYDGALFVDQSIPLWKARHYLALTLERLGQYEGALDQAKLVAAKDRAHGHFKRLEKRVAGEPTASPCPMCHEAQPVDFSPVGFDYTECPKCRIHFPHSVEIVTNPDLFPEPVVASAEQWRAANEYLANYTSKYAIEQGGPERLRVLEVMPGPLSLSKKLVELGHEVCAVDLSSYTAKVAEGTGIDVRTSTWEDFDLPEDWVGSFDMVVMIHAMQNMTDFSGGMAKVGECLKPGGRVFSRHPDVAADDASGWGKPEEAFSIVSHHALTKVLKDSGMVLEWRDLNGGQSNCWFKRAESGSPEIIDKSKDTSLWVGRPGAFGDILMSTYAVRELKKLDPERELTFVVHPSCSVILENNPWVDRIHDSQKPIPNGVDWKRFEYPTRAPKEGESAPQTSCVKHQGCQYPDEEMPYHIIKLFAECVGLEVENDRFDFGALELFFSPEEKKKAKDVINGRRIVTLQTGTGWSPYKEWFAERWAEVVQELASKEVKVLHIGGPNDPEVFSGGAPEHYLDLRGKLSIRLGAAVQKRALLHLGLDSLYNHSTNAVHTPGVILFGSTSPTGSGYPHNKDLIVPPSHGCQPCYRERNEISAHPKPACPYEVACMTAITPQMVLEAVDELGSLN